jgi:hypothetical protein
MQSGGLLKTFLIQLANFVIINGVSFCVAAWNYRK